MEQGKKRDDLFSFFLTVFFCSILLLSHPPDSIVERTSQRSAASALASATLAERESKRPTLAGKGKSKGHSHNEASILA